MTPLSGTRALVTGAGGFIGARLVAHLLAQGSEVHALDLPGSPVAEGAVGHCVDIRDRERIGALIAEVDPTRVFHLAAYKERLCTMESFARALDINLTGTLALLEACMTAGGLESFVSVGTCEEYGGGPTPFSADQREQPISAYSVSKVAATHLIQTFTRTFGLPAVVVRPTVAYGPGQAEDMFIPALVGALVRGEAFEMSPGEQSRDFVHVDDLVSALVATSQAPEAVGQVVNIGCGEPVRLKDLAHLAERLVGHGSLVRLGARPMRPGEALEYEADISFARDVLGWRAQVTLEQGLAGVIDAAKATAV